MKQRWTKTGASHSLQLQLFFYQFLRITGGKIELFLWLQEFVCAHTVTVSRDNNLHVLHISSVKSNNNQTHHAPPSFPFLIISVCYWEGRCSIKSGYLDDLMIQFLLNDFWMVCVRLYPCFFWLRRKSSSDLRPERSEGSQTSCWLCLFAAPLSEPTEETGRRSKTGYGIIWSSSQSLSAATTSQFCHHT